MAKRERILCALGMCYHLINVKYLSGTVHIEYCDMVDNDGLVGDKDLKLSTFHASNDVL